jgi:hypothetical protein
MTNIDKHRISAVRVLEALGYTFAADEWQGPATAAPSFIPSTDAMHGMLIRRNAAAVRRSEVMTRKTTTAFSPPKSVVPSMSY